MVTVGDDGGSSGRLRGDPRHPAARVTCGRRSPRSPTTAAPDRASCCSTGSPAATTSPGTRSATSCSCGLMELAGDPVVALDQAAEMLRCDGRVLPMSPCTAAHRGGSGCPTRRRPRSSPSAVSTRSRSTPSTVDRVRLVPGGAGGLRRGGRRDRRRRLAAVRARVVVHQRDPASAGARLAARDRARVRRSAWSRSTSRPTARRPDLSLPEHLARPAPLPTWAARRCSSCRRESRRRPRTGRIVRQNRWVPGLVLAPVAVADGAPRHDPHALATALEPLLSSTTDSSTEPREVTTRWR